MGKLTRRAALVGALTSSAAIVAPVALAKAPMDLHDRMAHHFYGLAEALGEWGVMARGEWQIRVNSLRPFYAIENLEATRARENMAVLIMAHPEAAEARAEANALFEDREAAACLPRRQIALCSNPDTGELNLGGEYEIRAWAKRCHFGFNDKAIETWEKRKLAQLQARLDEYDAVWEAAGLQPLLEDAEAKDQAEYLAFSAIVNAKPATLADAKREADYLLEIHAADDQRLEGWIEELLTSLGSGSAS